MAKSAKSQEELYIEFLELLGEYVVWSASTETVFISFLQLATRDGGAGPVTLWFQSTSTRARLEMVRNYFRARFGDGDTTRKICSFIERYKGLTRQRNFFCHARYETYPDGWRATGYQISETEEVIKSTQKRINRATCNELSRSIQLLSELHFEMLAFIEAYEKKLIESGALQAPILNIPERSGGA